MRSAMGYVAPARKIRGRNDDAAATAERAWHPQTHGLHFERLGHGMSAEVFDQVYHSTDHVFNAAIALRATECRASTLPVGVTRPPLMAVPPRSMPIAVVLESAVIGTS